MPTGLLYSEGRCLLRASSLKMPQAMHIATLGITDDAENGLMQTMVACAVLKPLHAGVNAHLRTCFGFVHSGLRSH